MWLIQETILTILYKEWAALCTVLTPREIAYKSHEDQQLLHEKFLDDT
jgi:hypothetical protein